MHLLATTYAYFRPPRLFIITGPCSRLGRYKQQPRQRKNRWERKIVISPLFQLSSGGGGGEEKPISERGDYYYFAASAFRVITAKAIEEAGNYKYQATKSFMAPFSYGPSTREIRLAPRSLPKGTALIHDRDPPMAIWRRNDCAGQKSVRETRSRAGRFSTRRTARYLYRPVMTRYVQDECPLMASPEKKKTTTTPARLIYRRTDVTFQT